MLAACFDPPMNGLKKCLIKNSGIVKWFNNAKGFGFILPDDGEGDIFAHYSSIEMDGYRTLKAGQSVTFNTEPGPRGPHAINIQAPADDSTDSNDSGDIVIETVSSS